MSKRQAAKVAREDRKRLRFDFVTGYVTLEEYRRRMAEFEVAA